MTLKDGDLLLVSRDGEEFQVKSEDMSNLLDTDLFWVQRDGVDYSVTADQVNTGGDITPPDIQGATLTENSPGGDRFTNSSFTTTIAYIEQGFPTPVVGMKAKVSGALSINGETSPITDVGVNAVTYTTTATPTSISNDPFSDVTAEIACNNNGSSASITFTYPNAVDFSSITKIRGGSYSLGVNYTITFTDENGVETSGEGPTGTGWAPTDLPVMPPALVKSFTIQGNDGYAFLGFRNASSEMVATGSLTGTGAVLSLTDRKDLDNGAFLVGDEVDKTYIGQTSIFLPTIETTNPERGDISEVFGDSGGGYVRPAGPEFGFEWLSEIPVAPGDRLNWRVSGNSVTWNLQTINDAGELNTYSGGINTGNGWANVCSNSSVNLDFIAMGRLYKYWVTGGSEGSDSGICYFSLNGQRIQDGMNINVTKEINATVNSISQTEPKMTVSGGDWEEGETVKNTVVNPILGVPESDEIVGVEVLPDPLPPIPDQSDASITALLAAAGVTAITGMGTSNRGDGFTTEIWHLSANGSQIQGTATTTEGTSLASSNGYTYNWEDWFTTNTDKNRIQGQGTGDYACTLSPAIDVVGKEITIGFVNYPYEQAEIWIYDQNGTRVTIVGKEAGGTSLTLASSDGLTNFAYDYDVYQDSGYTAETSEITGIETYALAEYLTWSPTYNDHGTEVDQAVTLTAGNYGEANKNSVYFQNYGNVSDPGSNTKLCILHFEKLGLTNPGTGITVSLDSLIQGGGGWSTISNSIGYDSGDITYTQTPGSALVNSSENYTRATFVLPANATFLSFPTSWTSVASSGTGGNVQQIANINWDGQKIVFQENSTVLSFEDSTDLDVFEQGDNVGAADIGEILTIESVTINGTALTQHNVNGADAQTAIVVGETLTTPGGASAVVHSVGDRSGTPPAATAWWRYVTGSETGTFNIGDQVIGPAGPPAKVVSVAPDKNQMTVDGGDWKAWNQSETWSDDVTGASDPSGAFDGDLTTKAEASASAGTVEWNPSGGLAYTSKVEVYQTNKNYNGVDSNLFFNNGPAVNVPEAGWYTLATGSGTITSIKSAYDNSYRGGFNAVRVDGKMLVDPTTNQSQVWSNLTTGEVTIGGLKGPISTLFDKDVTTGIMPGPGGTAGTFDVVMTLTQAIPCTSLAVYASESQANASCRVLVNGGTPQDCPNTGEYITLTPPSDGLLTSLTFRRVATAAGDNGVNFGAVKVNSVQLVDKGIGGESTVSCTYPAATGTVASTSGSKMMLKASDGRWVTNRGKYVTGDPTPVLEISAYTVFDGDGNVSRITTADPGYVNMSTSNNLQLSFGADLGTGQPTDDELPPNTSLTTYVKAESEIGSSSATSNSVTPAADGLRSQPDSVLQAAFVDQASRWATVDNRYYVYQGDKARAEMSDNLDRIQEKMAKYNAKQGK